MRFRVSFLVALAALVATPAVSFAQSRENKDDRAIGERYRVEAAATMWRPGLFGAITSTQLDLVGSKIDFANDLGFASANVTNLSVVLRPAKKHRFHFELSPASYSSNTTFNRIVTFAGIPFPVSLPIHSTFSWRTMRIGYEYDFIYKKRGFIGVLFEARIPA